MQNLPRWRDDGTLMASTDLGGYPLFYLTADNGVLCPKDANMAEREGLSGDPHDAQWNIVAAQINYEDAWLFCDHCSERIPSAYAEDEHETE